jgi:hypothetical protein
MRGAPLLGVERRSTRLPPRRGVTKLAGDESHQFFECEEIGAHDIEKLVVVALTGSDDQVGYILDKDRL